MEGKRKEKKRRPKETHNTLLAQPLNLFTLPYGVLGIISHRLDDAQTFCPPLANEDALSRTDELGPLDEAEGDGGLVAGADVRAVDVYDGAGLGDGADVEHCLVAGFDGGGVGEDEDCRVGLC